MKWSNINNMVMALLQRDSNNETNFKPYTLIAFANKALTVVANKAKPYIKEYKITINNDNETILLPNDFLSHNSMPFYYYDNNQWNNLPYNFIIFNTRYLTFLKSGIYKIYYNALYPFITKDNVTDDDELDIDLSVLQIIPLSIAAQIVLIEDPNLSLLIENKFELELMQLDTSIYQG